MVGDKDERNDLHIEVPDLTILDLEVTNEKITRELQTLKRRCESLQGENILLSQKLQENQSHLERLSAAEAKLNAVQELEGILENAMLELNFLQTKCDTLESEKAKFQQNADLLRKNSGTSDADKKKLLEEADLLRKECSALKSENSTLKSENSTLKSENSTLKSENSTLKSENSTLKSENSTLKSENSTLKSENSTLKSENSTLKSENSTLKSENSTLKSENSTLKSENSTLKSENSTLKSENSTLKSENSTLKSENSTLKSENSTLKSENSTFEEQLKESRTRKEAISSSPVKEKKESQITASAEAEQTPKEEKQVPAPPVQKAEPAAPQKMRKLFELVEEEKVTIPAEKKEKKIKAKRYVLLVHSDPVVNHGLNTILKNEGISPVVAESGQNALKLIDSQNFAAIIMDTNATSDGMTGAYLFKSIQKKNSAMSEKMIFTSREDPHSSFLGFLKTTSNRFFPNPLENAELVKYLSEL
ncbi:MAG: response regulator [Candidatus Xenobiia bacterium LiM19]